MMDAEIATIVSQFGAAGLMGLLWIAERRHAALRDRQLTEAHRLVAARESEAAALLGIVRENTRAIVTLEQTQRRLMHAVERLIERSGRTPGHAQRLHEHRDESTGTCAADAA